MRPFRFALALLPLLFSPPSTPGESTLASAPTSTSLASSPPLAPAPPSLAGSLSVPASLRGDSAESPGSPPLDPTALDREASADETPPQDGASIFEGRKILAFYGRPGSTAMGILGEYPKEALATLLFGYARLYDDASGGIGVIPAFYLVYGACWPGGEIGYLKDSVVREWIEYAAGNGIAIFLDHQIGRYGVGAAMQRLLPWLAYPNVHLALDPEWSTSEPMKTIGSISGEDLNKAQSLISDWLVEHGDRRERILVVHQFAAKMIDGRERVRADFPGVRLVHASDGFGSPSLKKKAYAWNALALNMPRKGFKLFMKTDVRGAGYDDPLLTPEEVIALTPSPELIIYQ